MVVIVEGQDSVRAVLSHEVVYDSIPHTLVLNVEHLNFVEIYSATETFADEHLADPFPVYNRFFVSNLSFSEEKLILPLIKNLNGKEIKLAGFNYRPYTFYKQVEPGTGNANLRNSSQKFDLELDGYEFLLFLQFCSKYNCTLNLETGEFLFSVHLLNPQERTVLFFSVVRRRRTLGQKLRQQLRFWHIR